MGARERRRWRREGATRKRRLAFGLLVLVALPLVLFPIGVFTQAADQTPSVMANRVTTDGGPSGMDLSSIAGITILTGVVVQLLKRDVIAKHAILGSVPIWLYAMAMAAGLAWVAHDVLHTLQGDGPQLIAQAVAASLMATGGYEILRAGVMKPLRDAGSTPGQDDQGPT